MSTMKNGRPVYYGPKEDTSLYPTVGSVSSNESVKVIWKEIANSNTWAHIEYSVTGTSQKKRGYVPADTVNITENVTTYNTSSQKRFVRTAGDTYLGPDATIYPIAHYVSLGTEVEWICSIRDGMYVYVEYSIGSGKKKRAYINANFLGTTAPTLQPTKYVQGNVINSSGDYWNITNQWNGNNTPETHGHLAIDVTRLNNGSKISKAEVYAIADGTIVSKGFQSANGNYVIIKHTTSMNKTYYSLYYHLDDYYEDKTQVSKNDAIGIMGDTGTASGGEHLHLGITRDKPAGNYYGYYRVNDVKTRFTNGENYIDYTADFYSNRFYNPTKYFTVGESLIDNNYN